VQEENGKHGPNERREGEIGASAGRAEMAQPEDKQREAHAVAKKTNAASGQNCGGSWERCALKQGER
jgi:hypothetical protein